MGDVNIPDDPKSKLHSDFKTIAGDYDAMHFLQVPARRLVELAALKAGDQVLDIATGTGVVAFFAAQQAGPHGHVTGIDLSPDMLSQARAKQIERGQSNITFQQGDAMHLDFPDAHFDAVLCASSIFFMPDFAAAINEWQRVLKPAGVLAFNTYEPPFIEPLNGLWIKRLQQHNIAGGQAPHHRLSDLATCEQLMRNAGFSRIDVHAEQLGYYLSSFDARWRTIEAGLEGMPLRQMPADLREQIKAEYAEDVADLMTDQGLWMNVPALFALGRR